MSIDEDHRGASILFVCTGNVARSPYMQYALRQRLSAAGAAGFSLSSAGVHAVVGHGMARPYLHRLSPVAADAAGFAARALSSAQIERAQLILTAERAHHVEVLRHDPRAADRTFAVGQFARLLAAAPGDASPQSLGPREAVQSLIEAAHAARGHAGRTTSEDDIPDPWSGSARVYRRAAERMDAALEPIAAALVRAVTRS